MSSGVILLQRPYISFSSPLLLILRQEITAAAVALFYLGLFLWGMCDAIFILLGFSDHLYLFTFGGTIGL